MYVQMLDEFERRAKIILKSNPYETRCVFKYDHSGSTLVIKVTDNKTCVMYKTHSQQDLKKLEKFVQHLLITATDHD